MRAARERLEAMRRATLRRAEEHDPEGHTIAWERQQIAALLDDTRAALASIDAAQQRLLDGQYGTCTACGREISAARLEALPATPTCLDCAG